MKRTNTHETTLTPPHNPCTLYRAPQKRDAHTNNKKGPTCTATQSTKQHTYHTPHNSPSTATCTSPPKPAASSAERTSHITPSDVTHHPTMSIKAKQIAINTATKSTHHKWHLGAVVWRGGSVIATGYNTPKNSPETIEDHKYFKCSIHAEIAALRKAGNTKGARLYVARITKNGSPACAKPCPRCLNQIKQHGIKEVHYTDNEKNWSQLKVAS